MFDPSAQAKTAVRITDPTRPFTGLYFLVVEDSRYVSEALRLMLLHSGGRIRRADSLASARRHLAAYGPSVAIIDLGLPDGNGLDLIRDLAATTPRIPVLMAVSGNADLEAPARAAGADGFLGKPLPPLAIFQTKILRHISDSKRLTSLGSAGSEPFHPDPLALANDLSRARGILCDDPDNPATIHYAASFLGGIASVANRPDLAETAAILAKTGASGGVSAVIDRIDALLAATETV